MPDLFTPQDSLQAGYNRIYATLTELREGFHRSGRLDDSNAKLDEVSKLFATYLAYKTRQITSFPNPDATDLLPILQRAFTETVLLPQYHLKSGGSIFGLQPSLALRPGDESIATDLTRLVRDCIDLAFDLRTAGRPFDILNEAFGHFIRDNFRGNIEDAQYMTPPEVVAFMADMALHDISHEGHEAMHPTQHLTVLDPSCGVGSFLAAVYSRARITRCIDLHRLRLYGQDKVERMVRLSTINLELFDVEKHQVTVGNSLEQGSAIDSLNGTVDLILTNPPFGARFDPRYISSKCGSNTPFFSSPRRTETAIDSELLFIDRDLRLLRDGGRLLIVVPDGVVSARGTAALLRQYLAQTVTVRAVVELPAVTFAQAGTRTKTAVLYLQKGRNDVQDTKVFLGVSRDLGFQVSSRKGVQIKLAEGRNDLPDILGAYRTKWSTDSNETAHVLQSEPSCVVAPESILLRAGSWTPNHYSAARFEAVATISRDPSFELVPLADLVEFCGDGRRPVAWQEGWAFVSVLHILGEGFVDVAGVLSYAPKTPGVPTQAGELLISRINPRIPRICITPDLGIKTLCSTEFEVMKPKNLHDAYTLAYVLQSSVVQKQICSLTSGTSASHNRIRTSDLAQVLVPVAKANTAKDKAIAALVREYKIALESLSKNSLSLALIRQRDSQIFNNQSIDQMT